MISLEEKLDVARAVGLEAQVSLLEHQQHRAEVARLTNLMFRPIEREEIERLIFRNLRRHPRSRLRVVGRGTLQGGGLGLLIGGCVGMMETLIQAFVTNTAPPTAVIWSMGIGGCLGILVGYWRGDLFLDVEKRPLISWPFELPYGALLAVQEAKTIGLTDFHIHYPTIRRADPVITGCWKGVKCLVFAWDEGLLYREGRDG